MNIASDDPMAAVMRSDVLRKILPSHRLTPKQVPFHFIHKNTSKPSDTDRTDPDGKSDQRQQYTNDQQRRKPLIMKKMVKTVTDIAACRKVHSIMHMQSIHLTTLSFCISLTNIIRSGEKNAQYNILFCRHLTGAIDNRRIIAYKPILIFTIFNIHNFY